MRNYYDYELILKSVSMFRVKQLKLKHRLKSAVTKMSKRDLELFANLIESTIEELRNRNLFEYDLFFGSQINTIEQIRNIK